MKKIIYYLVFASLILSSCSIEITKEDLISLNVCKKALIIPEGQSVTLITNVLPKTSKDTNVVWFSENIDVATISEKGEITAKKLGVVRIKVTSLSNSNLSEYCIINVSKNVTDLNIIKSLSLLVGQITFLKTNVFPKDATDTSVIFTSSDEKIAYVNANGQINARTAGTVKITVTSKSNPALFEECILTIYKPLNSLNIRNSLNLESDQAYFISTNVLPKDALDTTVIWSSDNIDVATVDAQSGLIKTKSTGTAKIIATSILDPSLKEICVLKVFKPLSSINIKTKLIIEENEIYKLYTNVFPKDASDTTVSWKSSDENIAIVNTIGQVIGKSKGTVNIIASSNINPSLNEVCTITVIESLKSLNIIKKLYLEIDETFKINTDVVPKKARDTSVIWSSENTDVATVDPLSGLIKAKSLGTVNILATSNVNSSLTEVCVLNVIKALSSINIIKSLTLNEKETYNLVTNVLPKDATDTSVIWKSSNENIATVSPDGQILAKSKGTVSIIATSVLKPSLNEICLLTVTRTLSKLNISSNLFLELNKTFKLITNVFPKDVNDTSVIWSSDNLNVATVDENTGLINSKNYGTALIKATSVDNPSLMEICTLKVIKPLTKLNIMLNLTLKELETYKLITNVIPKDATDSTITWRSYNENIATVNSNGLVKAISKGYVFIVATSLTTPSLNEVCLVNVIKLLSSLNIEKSLNLEVNKSYKLNTNVLPKDANDTSVVWISDNENVATVDLITGVINTKSLGTANIKAISIGNQNLIETCVLKVIKPLTSLNIKKNLVLKETETYKLTTNVLPKDATDTSVTWKSSDENIATVSSNGLIQAKSSGFVFIIATSINNPSLNEACYVTVTKPLSSLNIISSLILDIDKTYKIGTNVLPKNAYDTSVIWSSDNINVASIDPQSGLITPKSIGTANIRATSKDNPSLSEICVLKVIKSLINLNIRTSLTLKELELFKLGTNVFPKDATDTSVTWRSTDEKIATVTSNGIVQAKSGGFVFIIATSVSNPSLSEVCYLTISKTILSLNILKNLTLKSNEFFKLGTNVFPKDATDTTVIWTSENLNIATVDAQTGLVNAKAGGTVNIIATSKANPSLSEICVLKVTKPLTSLNIRTSLALKELETFRLVTNVLPKDATDTTVTWRSSDTNIATISSDGQIQAKVKGTVNIIATSNSTPSISQICVLTITKPLTLISLNITPSLTLKPNDFFRLVTNVFPKDVGDTTVNWTSDNPSIATVDAQTGIVVAKVGGTVNIKATSKANPSLSEICVLKVTKPLVSLNIRTSLTLKELETFRLVTNVLPKDATDTSVTWRSSDTNIATVSSDGLIQAKAKGTVNIIATSISDPLISAVCVLTVTKSLLSLNIIPSLTLKSNDVYKLGTNVFPKDISDTTVIWTSDNPSIASVDAQTGVVVAKTGGIANIKATSNTNPSLSEICVLKVTKPLTSLNIRTSLTLKELETFILVTNVLPKDATDTTVTWRSSDLNIATISSNGQIQAKVKGTVNIIATSNSNPTLSEVCILTVTKSLLSLNILPSLTLKPTESFKLGTNVLPKDATDTSVIWTSENINIATVDAQTGLVSAKTGGIVNIRATSKANPSLSEICVLKVTKPLTSLNIRTSLTLKELETFILVTNVLPKDATDTTVTWRSSDVNIATISPNGQIQAKVKGTVNIIATSNSTPSISEICVLTVTKSLLSLNILPSLTLKPTESFKLGTNVLPKDATDTSVIWTSDNPLIATVDAQTGQVNAKAGGTVNIRATSKANPSLTEICVLKVIKPLTSLNLRTSLTLKETEIFKITTNVLPKDATDTTVTWRSSDVNIATINSNGEIQAKIKGTVNIIATSNSNSLITEVCTLTVIRTLTSLNILSSLTLKSTEKFKLGTNVLPKDANDTSVTWSSGNPLIATVDAQTGLVSAKNGGIVAIRATSNSNPSLSEVCILKVIKPLVSLNLRTSLTLRELEIFKLTTNALPKDATDTSVTWRSSDENIATINASGQILAKFKGTANIIATSNSDPSIIEVCTLTVTKTTISLNIRSSLNLKSGQTYQLGTNVNPKYNSDTSIVWSSDNVNVATVDPVTGLVEAKSGGFVIIRATSKILPTINEMCDLYVVKLLTSINIRPTLSLNLEDNYRMGTNVSPKDASDTSVFWSSENTNIATVDGKTGLVTTKTTEGTVKISAISNGNPVLIEYCTLTVNKNVQTISLPISINMVVGETRNLTLTYKPQNLVIQSINWSTSDSSIATVQNGAVKANKAGTVIITVTTVNPSLTTRCEITITN